MIAHDASIRLETKGNLDMHDLTDRVAEVVRDAGVTTGLATVFVPGSTGGLTTIEFESGALRDLAEAVERLVPENIAYAHNARWGDGNGHSHVRAALLRPDLTIPIQKGRLTLGTWQQILFIDCDNRARRREIVVTVVGQ
ncbi:MAG: secondary thiamine-phosphate synthase enzyme YjbQ [Candidatus Lernaella stagnicola]|nr:secondary thiamine-phosphate synthase enzyme YjbQ [Candidatus Lernaella stagnicola]